MIDNIYDDTLRRICTVLMQSIKKHGNKPLTTEHLLNILRMAAWNMYQDEYEKLEELEHGWPYIQAENALKEVLKNE